MRRILYWLTGFLPCRIIGEDGTPYLERYYLFTAFGVRVYLHRFLASDTDCGFHDHPWSWTISIILSGCYWERTRCSVRMVRWGNLLTGDTFHRIELPVNRRTRCVWTLFMHRARDAKEWGFLRGMGQAYMVYTPFSFPRNERLSAWFKQAPRGRRESRRMPL